MADLGILGLSRGAPSLTNLDLSGCTGVTDAGIAHLSSLVVSEDAGERGRARLECLRLDGLPGVSDDGLDALLGASSSETTISPTTPPSSSATAAAAAAARAAAGRAAAVRAAGEPGAGAGDAEPSQPLSSSRLRVLSLCGCRGVTDQGLATIGASAPLRSSLREIDLTGTSATEAGLESLLLLKPPSVEGGGTEVGRRVAPLRLESLGLPAKGRGVTGAGLSALSTVTSLVRLDLEGCGGPGVTSQALAGKGVCLFCRWWWL